MQLQRAFVLPLRCYAFGQLVKQQASLSTVVRSTGTSTIYAIQPESDALNLLDLDGNSAELVQARVGEKLRFRISGEESQIAVIDIYPGETVRSESDKVIFMSEGVAMNTHRREGSMMKRFLTGSSLFVTDYTYEEQRGYGRVAFAENIPSKILPIRLDEYGGSINCKKGSYICGTKDVDISIITARKLSTGLFGGEGFILQQLKQELTGSTVLLRAQGGIIKRSLRDGEKIKVTPGIVVAFDPKVVYNMEMIPLRGKSFMNMFGGARSMFQATFTGPGDVYLQSNSFSTFSAQISAEVSKIVQRKQFIYSLIWGLIKHIAKRK